MCGRCALNLETCYRPTLLPFPSRWPPEGELPSMMETKLEAIEYLEYLEYLNNTGNNQTLQALPRFKAIINGFWQVC